MPTSRIVEIEMPEGMGTFHLPEGVHSRLQELLDRQDGGQNLSQAERKEAEGLVELSEWLSLLRLRTQRLETAVIPAP